MMDWLRKVISLSNKNDQINNEYALEDEVQINPEESIQHEEPEEVTETE